jgi:hypothetical protein
MVKTVIAAQLRDHRPPRRVAGITKRTLQFSAGAARGAAAGAAEPAPRL